MSLQQDFTVWPLSYWTVLSCGSVYYAVQGVSNFTLVDEILFKSVSIQMEATEQYIPVVLFILLYKAVPTFESVDEILSVTIQTKAIKQYVPVVLVIILYKVVLTVDEILTCDHSNTPIQMKAVEQYVPVVQYAVKGRPNVLESNPKVCHSNESCWAVLPCGVFYTVKGGFNF